MIQADPFLGYHFGEVKDIMEWDESLGFRDEVNSDPYELAADFIQHILEVVLDDGVTSRCFRNYRVIEGGLELDTIAEVEIDRLERIARILSEDPRHSVDPRAG